jgi:hypothetical protein
MKRLKQSFIKWLVVSLFCLLLGFLLGKFKQEALQDALGLMKVELQMVASEKVELTKKVAAIEAAQITDKQTIKRLTAENKRLNDELNLLANKLYFYERVVAPELQSSGVQIYSFSVYKESDSAQWRYELILMQAAKERRFLKGERALNFSVVEDNRQKSVPITEFSKEFTSAFKFKYFQTIEGVFTLPASLQVDELVLTLNVPGNRWYKAQRVEQHYNWQTLINSDKEEQSEKAENIVDLLDSDDVVKS